MMFRGFHSVEDFIRACVNDQQRNWRCTTQKYRLVGPVCESELSGIARHTEDISYGDKHADIQAAGPGTVILLGLQYLKRQDSKPSWWVFNEDYSQFYADGVGESYEDVLAILGYGVIEGSFSVLRRV